MMGTDSNTSVYHMGLIPDGTRRWARSHGIDYYSSYLISMKKLMEVLAVVYSQDVRVVSVYLLSKENLVSRSTEDLEAVFAAEEHLLRYLLPDFCEQWGCTVHHAGTTVGLPANYVDALNRIVTPVRTSATGIQRRLYLLVGYNPWEEIENAIRSSGDADEFRRHLWVPEELDLVVRTGSAQLLSNFLPLQAGYAELVFVSKYFNDIDTQDILLAIDNCRPPDLRLVGR